MQIQLETQPYASLESDALVTYVFDKDDKFDGLLGDIDTRHERPPRHRWPRTAKSPANRLNLCCSIFPKGSSAKKLLLVGAGKPGKVRRLRPAQDRRNGAAPV